MVFHCTTYPNIVFTSQVLSLASSRLRESNIKNNNNNKNARCALGNLNHPIQLQRTQPPSAVLRLLDNRMPSSHLMSRVSFEKINKARIVKEGVGITFFALGLESELMGHRSMVLWGKCTFSRVSLVYHIFRKKTNKKKHPTATKATHLMSIGTMCKICSKAK